MPRQSTIGFSDVQAPKPDSNDDDSLAWLVEFIQYSIDDWATATLPWMISVSVGSRPSAASRTPERPDARLVGFVYPVIKAWI
jgi:hypothetical protein